MPSEIPLNINLDMSGNSRSDCFTGAFSVLKASKVGTGTTTQKHVQTMYVYAEEQPDGTFALQYINDNFVPTGKAWSVTREELLASHTPEPDLYMNKVFPAMRELTKTIAHAERLRDQGQTYSAEYEFKKALRIDETNIRATFGFGLTYLDRGEAEKADLVFRRLVTLEAAFESEHKHLFNEFGIKLRKSGLLEQALQFYGRAAEYTGDDEHLHYNRARVLADMSAYGRAREDLERALDLNPDFGEARSLLVWVEKQAEIAAADGADGTRLGESEGDRES